MKLNDVSTRDLSQELETREGVSIVRVSPYEKIEVGNMIVEGPAVILINQD